MEAVARGGAPANDKLAMVERVVAYGRRFYAGEVSETTMRAWAVAAVDDVWGEGPRVTGYVPTLALRTVRAQMLASLAVGRASGEIPPTESERNLPG